MSHQPVAVIFYYNGEFVRVPMEEITCDTKGIAEKVVMKKDDGREFECWAKSWWDSETLKLIRVGAGAAGDSTVWQHVQKYVIIHTYFGNDLTGPRTLEEINVGTQAFPVFKAMNLRIGQTLDSTFNDERAIRRVS